jgi:hypothetical protein
MKVAHYPAFLSKMLGMFGRKTVAFTPRGVGCLL